MSLDALPGFVGDGNAVLLRHRREAVLREVQPDEPPLDAETVTIVRFTLSHSRCPHGAVGYETL